MIVLDTNVLSEASRAGVSESVVGWFRQQDQSTLFTTVITMAEMLQGVELLPEGKRRASLSAGVQQLFNQVYAGRILPFDESAARAYSTIVAAHKRAGRPISTFDAAIAAIAKTHHAALATRNTQDFAHCGVRLIDPWTGR